MTRRRRLLAVIALVAAVAGAAAVGPARAAQWYKSDLHVHSVFSADAFPDLGIISQSAKAAGFNAIFLTDHNLASNFPISGMTANHMFFRDSLRRWTQATTGTLSSSTNALASSPVHGGTQSLRLTATSSSAGETFIWTKRGPNLRATDAIVKFSVNVRQLTGSSGVYVSASIGGDPTVHEPANNPVGYTTVSGAISPGKSNVLVWYLGSPPPSSFYGTARVVTHELDATECDKAFALNTWVTCTIDVTKAAKSDIPLGDQPLDYNAFSNLKLSAVGQGGTADANFDDYSIDATSSSADEFVYRTSIIHGYDTSSFTIFPSVEMGVDQHAQRFNFDISDPSQFVSYSKGIDGIAPTEATGYPAQLNHPGVDGGVTDAEAISTNAEGAELMEVRKQNMIDDWDAILRKGVPLVATWGGDNHIGKWTTGSQATSIRAGSLDFDALITALRQGKAFLTAGISGMTFNLDGSSEPYPAATPVSVPASQTSATVHLSIAGGLRSGDTVKWLSNGGSSSTTSVIATDTAAGATYARSRAIPLSGSSTYVRAEVRSSSGSLRGMTEAILFKRSSSGGDSSPPTAPSGLTARASGTSEIDLSWSASTDDVAVTGYRVYRDGGSTPLATVGGTATSYADTGLAAGSTHTYQVTAIDAAGNESGRSNTAGATTDVGGGSGAIALVSQRTASGGSTATSLATTIPATAAGDTLVATFAIATGGSKSITSVTDSAGGTWTKGPVGFLSGSNTRAEIWFRAGVPAGITSVTATLSAGAATAANVSEWSGVATTSPLAAHASQGNASTTTATTPTITVGAGDLVIGAIDYSGSATATLASSGFSALNAFSSGTSANGRAAYRIVTSSGNVQASWTLSTAAASGGVIIALKPA